MTISRASRSRSQGGVELSRNAKKNLNTVQLFHILSSRINSNHHLNQIMGKILCIRYCISDANYHVSSLLHFFQILYVNSHVHFLFVKMHKIFPTNGQSETTSSLVFTLTKVRLCTFDSPKLHPKWKPFNGIGAMECMYRVLYTKKKL